MPSILASYPIEDLCLPPRIWKRLKQLNVHILGDLPTLPEGVIAPYAVYLFEGIERLKHEID